MATVQPEKVTVNVICAAGAVGRASGAHAGGWLCECHPGLRGRGAVSVVHGR